MKPLFIKKNGTVSKVSGIIMNLIPSYTLAEYNALTHKPLLWIRTDIDYAQIPAEDVSYGSGSVKDALDADTTAIGANATAINNLKKEIGMTVSTNLNDCTDPYAMYYITGPYAPINVPETGAYNAIVWNKTVGAYTIQFYFSYNKITLYYRCRQLTSWSAWKIINVTSL